jgi:hypothetical protein
MLTNYLIIDVSSAPIEGAEAYVEPDKRLKDPVKIAENLAAKREKAALDLDLARISGVGFSMDGGEPRVYTLPHADDEAMELHQLRSVIGKHERSWNGVAPIITYNGRSFDLPLLMRRARYLGVDFPTLNLDRYKSPHVDLMEVLSDRDPSRRRSLGFYVKRLGWTDLEKPLSGAEEARVFETGDWDGLAASLRHDVEAVRRLAVWLGVIAP